MVTVGEGAVPVLTVQPDTDGNVLSNGFVVELE